MHAGFGNWLGQFKTVPWWSLLLCWQCILGHHQQRLVSPSLEQKHKPKPWQYLYNADGSLANLFFLHNLEFPSLRQRLIFVPGLLTGISVSLCRSHDEWVCILWFGRFISAQVFLKSWIISRSTLPSGGSWWCPWQLLFFTAFPWLIRLISG